MDGVKVLHLTYMPPHSILDGMTVRILSPSTFHRTSHYQALCQFRLVIYSQSVYFLSTTCVIALSVCL